jgi:hypothetical protein
LYENFGSFRSRQRFGTRFLWILIAYSLSQPEGARWRAIGRSPRQHPPQPTHYKPSSLVPPRLSPRRGGRKPMRWLGTVRKNPIAGLLARSLCTCIVRSFHTDSKAVPIRWAGAVAGRVEVPADCSRFVQESSSVFRANPSCGLRHRLRRLAERKRCDPHLRHLAERNRCDLRRKAQSTFGHHRRRSRPLQSAHA